MTFKEFLATQTIDLPLEVFVPNLLLAVVLGWLLAVAYLRFGHTLSDRATLARALVPIAATTMLIIALVKSSLALSLGLVGALSIVRFRTAIKEPEELAYLFVAIAVGVGTGANQRVITVIAFVVLVLALGLRALPLTSRQRQHGALTVAFSSGDLDVERVVGAISPHARSLSLLRFDADPEGVVATFGIELEGLAALEKVRAAVREIESGATLAFLERGA